MKIFSRLRTVAAVTLIAGFGLLAAGCNQTLPPQHGEYSCPVQNPDEWKAILDGQFGADSMGRPLNSQHVPVDANGNCLTEFPVSDVYPAQTLPPAFMPVYHSYYPGVVYVYHPFTPIFVPGIVIRTGPPPMRTVIVQSHPRPVTTVVTTPGGVTRTFTPGAAGVNKVVTTPVAPTSTVRPGASPAAPSTVAPSTVKPGAAPAVTAPSSVTPPAPKADTPSTFNRPSTSTPAPAVTAPSSVTPPAAKTDTPSTFNRPSTSTPAPAPAVTAPSSVTPPRAAPSAPSTFNRPSSTPSVSRPSFGGGGSSFRPSSGGRR